MEKNNTTEPLLDLSKKSTQNSSTEKLISSLPKDLKPPILKRSRAITNEAEFIMAVEKITKELANKN
jgi:hypothetical protein